MIRNYKYRLMPTRKQEERMLEILELLRHVYNATIQERQMYYQQRKRFGLPTQALQVCRSKVDRKTLRGTAFASSPTLFDQIYDIKDIRKLCPEYASFPFKFVEGAVTQVKMAYDAFFALIKDGARYAELKATRARKIASAEKQGKRPSKKWRRPPGLPWFKPKGAMTSMLHGNFNPKNLRIDLLRPKWKSTLNVKGIGAIPIIYARAAPAGAVPKVLTIKWEQGKNKLLWFAIFSYEGDFSRENLGRKPIAIHYAIRQYITMHDGTVIDSPMYLAQWRERLNEARRKLSGMQGPGKKNGKPSKRWVKQAHYIAWMERVVRESRRIFEHQVTTNLVHQYAAIASSGYHIVNMMEKNKLPGAWRGKAGKLVNSHIADAAWARLNKMIEYKAEEAGIPFRVGEVLDEKPAQTCSRCLATNQINAKTTVYQCSQCQLKMNRYQNAALNTYREAYGKVVNEMCEDSEQELRK